METLFDRDQILDVLHGFNPWWTGRGVAVPTFRRMAYATCRRFLDEPLLRRAVLLSGPRRVGKSTVVLQVADALLTEGRDPRSVLYLSLDHPLLRLVSLPELLKLYHERVHPEGEPVALFLDEVQYAQDWDLHVKLLVDHRPFYRILATGSASAVQHQRLAESGVGRWVRVPMPPLSFAEFLAMRGETPEGIPRGLHASDLFEAPEADLKRWGVKFRSVMPLFQRYLLIGGFPEAASLDNVTLGQRLVREDVVERVLKRDMAAIFRIRKVDDIERLFLYLCTHTGGILGVQTCATALRTSATTVSNHLEALEQGNLIYQLSPCGLGGKKVLKARRKVFLADAALRNAVLVRGEDVLTKPDEMGLIVETTVLRHLLTFHHWDTPTIHYWRDRSTGKEVDFIVRSPREVVPVEVKYRANATLAENEGVVHYCRHENIPRAYWVTQRERDFDVVQFSSLHTRFLRIPAHIFCYLLGQGDQPDTKREET